MNYNKKNVKKYPAKRYHLILDIVALDNKYLNNQNFLKDVIKEVSDIIEMQILHGPTVVKGQSHNPGLTAFCIVDYSHISIHTFTREKEFYFDVFSCKPFNYSKVKKYLVKKLNIDSHKVFEARPKYEK